MALIEPLTHPVEPWPLCVPSPSARLCTNGFEALEKAMPRLTSDSLIQLDDNIPIPNSPPGHGTNFATMRSMDVGQSFVFVPRTPATSLEMQRLTVSKFGVGIRKAGAEK